MTKEIFNTDEVMIFIHKQTKQKVETTNMFYLAFPNAWEFVGYKEKE